MTDLCNEIEKFGKGIGSTPRYRIVEGLFKGPRTVTQLVKAVKQSQPLVSQNLKTLKVSGIVVDERRGREVYYSLNAGHIVQLLKELTGEIGRHKKTN